jgi:CubicO group peptidase (beta-lactamase class C family)
MLLWLALACTAPDSVAPDDTDPIDTDPVDTDPVDTDPADPPDPAAPQVDAAALDALLADFVAAQRVPSAAACAIGEGTVLWCGAAGMADVEAGRAATPDTPYLLASLSKAVIGLAVARLVDEGTITLDDTIEPIVGFPLGSRRDRGAAITWRTLVTHTSGVRDNWAVMDRYYTTDDSPVALGAFLTSYLTPAGDEFRPSHFADHDPGARAVYSNIASALAAYAVEVVVARPFDDWCDAELFAPLGLTNTHWHLADFPADAVAVPYARRDGALSPVPHYGIPDYPDGQLRGSARDVATLLADVAGAGGRALSPAAATLLLTPPLPTIDPAQGVFWYAEARGGVPVWGHNGGEVGASTDAFFDPGTGAGFVLLVNAEPPAGPMRALETALLTAATDALR